MKLKTVLRSTVRHPKKIPLWLRRMDLVKAEMKTVRFPRTAREGFRQCVELSENVRRWFWDLQGILTWARAREQRDY